MKKFPYKIVKTENVNKCCEKVALLENEIEQATVFVKNIESGNLDATLTLETEGVLDKDSLAGSLISMRDQMKTIAEQEHERNWATEGLAKFVEILRSNNDDLQTLSDKILSSLIKYINANQGYLFILNDNDAAHTYLELKACFAYNKKKYIKREVEKGEGLIGQCFLEKETTYLTEVPANYVKITSGIGESLPRNIVVVPLKLNDEVFGVVEMASFHKIQKYQIEFLEKLGESIASTIATVKVNERTKRLLGEAQQMAEQMRAQEEEMRQNMEELAATQEEMQRKQGMLEEKERYMNQVINASTDIIYTIDKEFTIITCNEALKNSATGKHYKVDVGANALKVLTFGDPAKEASYKAIFNRVYEGEVVQHTDHIVNEVRDVYVSSTYSPIKNKAGEVEGIAIFIKDITEVTVAKLQAESTAEALKLQAEELKAQQEELQQNMEELSATQEELERRNKEIEDIRQREKERADNQISSQKRIMEQFMAKTKVRETQLLARIQELESQFNNSMAVNS